ncbi:uncharacterized protein MKK02DRAFT_44012 [Dioszegia hungarica]|uniref:Uncharacterized protein n=1 Tax=Dioszegia hungarica TaxID=4972 RepID=A0AA38LVI2_9TREE|nr:uncharacterized protein MKK02DRAFT_44012 [Dioszegia hungarica]KAI9635326.1 hypothetical protein MKK02DRAFT_44012 [Dioszegia hungarica]
MSRDSGGSQADLLPMPRGPTGTDPPGAAKSTPVASIPWYRSFATRASLLLVTSIMIAILLYLASSSIDSARSRFGLVVVELPPSSYKLAQAALPAEQSDEEALRKRATGTSLTIDPWDWCIAASASTAVILSPANFPPFLLRMLFTHILASIGSLGALIMIGLYLWRFRSCTDGSVRPGWLQYGPALATAILSTISWAADLYLVHSINDHIPSSPAASASGLRLTGIAAAVAWLLVLVWGGPALIRGIRSHFQQQRQYANSYLVGHGRGDIEAGELDHDLPEEKTVQEEIRGQEAARS